MPFLNYSKQEILLAIIFYIRKMLVPLNHLVNFSHRNKMRKSLSEAQKKFWEDNGFLILKQHFQPSEMDDLDKFINSLWANRHKPDFPSIVIDVEIGTPREKRIYLKDVLEHQKKLPYKLNDLYLEYDFIRNIVLENRLHGVLTELLEGYPAICNSLSFERGSQQDFHFDTFFMAPVVANKMVASWIAIEDSLPESGPLVYYPGSHKIPPYKFSTGLTKIIQSEMEDCKSHITYWIKKLNLEPQTFIPQKGDVLIWHSQLLHGGSPIQNLELTRKSLVTHYFRTIDYSPFYVKEFSPKKFHLNRKHQKIHT